MKSNYWLAVCLSVVLVCAGRSLAQADKPLDDIPLEVRTADRLSDVQKQEVHQYITGWVGVLPDSTNPQQQAAARDKLANGAVPIGTETASLDYQNEYAAEINDALLPLTKNAAMRVRLLAGIVAGRVAEKINNTRLEALAVALLQDKSNAVVLWGMRTGRYVLPWVLRNPMQNSPLPAAMVTAMAAHPEIPLANDAYEAADLANESGNAPLLAAAQQTLHLLQARVDEYQRACPVDPSADSVGTTFLSISAWGILPPEQRIDTVQQISDLLSVMSQRCLADGPDQIARTLSGLQFVAKAIYVIGTAEQAPEVVTAANAVAQQHFAPQTPPGDIIALVAKIYPALVAVPDFAKLKAPPKLQPATAPTAPH